MMMAVLAWPRSRSSVDSYTALSGQHEIPCYPDFRTYGGRGFGKRFLQPPLNSCVEVVVKSSVAVFNVRSRRVVNHFMNTLLRPHCEQFRVVESFKQKHYPT